MQNLKDYCHTRNISYVAIPFAPKNYFIPYGGTNEMMEIMKTRKYLKENLDLDNAFIEVAKYNLEDDYILINKVKKSAI